MIPSRIEPAQLAPAGPARKERQELEAPAFEDAMRERESPATAANAGASDAPDAPEVTQVTRPLMLDVLIAQLLPGQQAVAGVADHAASPSADQPVSAAFGPNTGVCLPEARETAPAAAPANIPFSGEVERSFAAHGRGDLRDSAANAGFENVAGRTIAPEDEAPVDTRVTQVREPSAQDAAQLELSNLAALAGSGSGAQLQPSHMERTQSSQAQDASLRRLTSADKIAPRANAQVELVRGSVRQQLDVDQRQQAPGSLFSAQEAPSAGTARGRDVKADATPSSEFRRVAIRQVETSNHFPVLADPVRQIASEVTRAIETPAAAAPAAPLTNTVKTINVQLEPESLGVVTLRMRLSGNNLQVRVDVAEPATLDLIQRDRDRLQKSMTSDNVSIERLEIRAATESSPTPSREGSNAQRQEMNAPDQQARQNGAPQGGEPRRENRGDSRQGHTKKNGQENDSARGSVSRGVYL